VSVGGRRQRGCRPSAAVWMKNACVRRCQATRRIHSAKAGGSLEQPHSMKRTFELSIRGSCRFAGPGDWREPSQSTVSAGRPRGLVPLTHGSEELVEWSVQGMGEGVPGLESADGAPLLNLDEGPSGQAASSSELVIGPAARRPQPAAAQAPDAAPRNPGRAGRSSPDNPTMQTTALSVQTSALFLQVTPSSEGQRSALPCAGHPTLCGYGADMTGGTRPP